MPGVPPRAKSVQRAAHTDPFHRSKPPAPLTLLAGQCQQRLQEDVRRIDVAVSSSEPSALEAELAASLRHSAQDMQELTRLMSERTQSAEQALESLGRTQSVLEQYFALSKTAPAPLVRLDDPTQALAALEISSLRAQRDALGFVCQSQRRLLSDLLGPVLAAPNPSCLESDLRSLASARLCEMEKAFFNQVVSVVQERDLELLSLPPGDPAADSGGPPSVPAFEVSILEQRVRSLEKEVEDWRDRTLFNPTLPGPPKKESSLKPVLDQVLRLKPLETEIHQVVSQIRTLNSVRDRLLYHNPFQPLEQILLDLKQRFQDQSGPEALEATVAEFVEQWFKTVNSLRDDREADALQFIRLSQQTQQQYESQLAELNEELEDLRGESARQIDMCKTELEERDQELSEFYRSQHEVLQMEAEEEICRLRQNVDRQIDEDILEKREELEREYLDKWERKLEELSLPPSEEYRCSVGLAELNEANRRLSELLSKSIREKNLIACELQQSRQYRILLQSQLIHASAGHSVISVPSVGQPSPNRAPSSSASSWPVSPLPPTVEQRILDSLSSFVESVREDLNRVNWPMIPPPNHQIYHAFTEMEEELILTKAKLIGKETELEVVHKHLESNVPGASDVEDPVLAGKQKELKELMASMQSLHRVVSPGNPPQSIAILRASDALDNLITTIDNEMSALASRASEYEKEPLDLMTSTESRLFELELSFARLQRDQRSKESLLEKTERELADAHELLQSLSPEELQRQLSIRDGTIELQKQTIQNLNSRLNDTESSLESERNSMRCSLTRPLSRSMASDGQGSFLSLSASSNRSPFHLAATSNPLSRSMLVAPSGRAAADAADADSCSETEVSGSLAPLPDVPSSGDALPVISSDPAVPLASSGTRSMNRSVTSSTMLQISLMKEKEVEELQSKLLSEKAKVHELSARIEDLESLNVRLRGETNRLESELSQSTAHCDSLLEGERTKMTSKYESQIASNVAEMERLQGQLDDLLHSSSNFSVVNQAKDNEIASLRSALARTKKEMGQRVDELENSNVEMQKGNYEMKLNLQSAVSQYDAMLQEMDQARARLATYISMERQLTVEVEKNQELSATCEELTELVLVSDDEERDRRFLVLQARETDKLRQILDSTTKQLITDLKTLETDMYKYESDYNFLHIQYTALESNHQNQQSDFERQRAQLMDTITKLNQTVSELEDAQQDADQLFGSQVNNKFYAELDKSFEQLLTRVQDDAFDQIAVLERANRAQSARINELTAIIQKGVKLDSVKKSIETSKSSFLKLQDECYSNSRMVTKQSKTIAQKELSVVRERTEKDMMCESLHAKIRAQNEELRKLRIDFNSERSVLHARFQEEQRVTTQAFNGHIDELLLRLKEIDSNYRLKIEKQKSDYWNKIEEYQSKVNLLRQRRRSGIMPMDMDYELPEQMASALSPTSRRNSLSGVAAFTNQYNSDENVYSFVGRTPRRNSLKPDLPGRSLRSSEFQARSSSVHDSRTSQKASAKAQATPISVASPSHRLRTPSDAPANQATSSTFSPLIPRTTQSVSLPAIDWPPQVGQMSRESPSGRAKPSPIGPAEGGKAAPGAPKALRRPVGKRTIPTQRSEAPK